MVRRPIWKNTKLDCNVTMPIKTSVWKKKNVVPRMIEDDPIEEYSKLFVRIPDIPLSKIKSNFFLTKFS